MNCLSCGKELKNSVEQFCGSSCLADYEIKKVFADNESVLNKCWFCGSGEPAYNSIPPVQMHKYIGKIDPQKYPSEFKNIFITVPRCKSCETAHAKAAVLSSRILLTAAIVFTLIFYFVTYPNLKDGSFDMYFYGFSLMALIISFWYAGKFIGRLFFLEPKKVKPCDPLKYPVVEDFKKLGWDFSKGTKAEIKEQKIII